MDWREVSVFLSKTLGEDNHILRVINHNYGEGVPALIAIADCYVCSIVFMGYVGAGRD